MYSEQTHNSECFTIWETRNCSQGNLHFGLGRLVWSFPRRKVIQHPAYVLLGISSLPMRKVTEVNFSLQCPHGNPIPAPTEPKGTWWYFWTQFFLGNIIKLRKTNTWCLHSTFLLKSSADIILLILTDFLRFADRGTTGRCLRSIK